VKPTMITRAVFESWNSLNSNFQHRHSCSLRIYLFFLRGIFPIHTIRPNATKLLRRVGWCELDMKFISPKQCQIISRRHIYFTDSLKAHKMFARNRAVNVMHETVH